MLYFFDRVNWERNGFLMPVRVVLTNGYLYITSSAEEKAKKIDFRSEIEEEQLDSIFSEDSGNLFPFTKIPLQFISYAERIQKKNAHNKAVEIYCKGKNLLCFFRYRN